MQAKLGKSLAHLDRCAAGAQGVILVGERHAEDGHHRVADELLHAALVALDDLLHPLEVPRQQRAQRLRVGRLPEHGRAHDVAEQDGDDLALLRTRRARRSPALGTELERLGGLVAANSTSRHHPSVGRPDWKKTSFFLV